VKVFENSTTFLGKRSHEKEEIVPLQKYIRDLFKSVPLITLRHEWNDSQFLDLDTMMHGLIKVDANWAKECSHIQSCLNNILAEMKVQKDHWIKRLDEMKFEKVFHGIKKMLSCKWQQERDTAQLETYVLCLRDAVSYQQEEMKNPMRIELAIKNATEIVNDILQSGLDQKEELLKLRSFVLSLRNTKISKNEDVKGVVKQAMSGLKNCDILVGKILMEYEKFQYCVVKLDNFKRNLENQISLVEIEAREYETVFLQFSRAIDMVIERLREDEMDHEKDARKFHISVHNLDFAVEDIVNIISI
jgi:hypothetical protein